MFAGEASRALGPDALFGRIGGEEFGALIPVRDDHEAVAIAHHVRRSFTAAAEHCVLGLRPTVSIGVALAADPGASLDGLLAAADRALYRAKAKGRNRVEYADVAAAVLDAGDPVAGAAGETAPGEDRVWRRAAGG
jgi:diguanylate cyclase (GGDEF)-like protein